MSRQRIQGRLSAVVAFSTATARTAAATGLMMCAVLLATSAAPFDPIEDDFSTDSKRWIYKGMAYRDAASEYVVLTTPTDWQWGIIWFDEEIKEPFRVSFKYKAGGGSGADGLVFMFYKRTDYEPDWGGCLAFSALPENSQTPVPGYGIEFDNFYNGGQLHDPSARHIALLKDVPGNHIVSIDDARVEDFQWHGVEVEVNVGPPGVSVLMDGSEVIKWSGPIDRTYGGFGFSGATGALNNWHVIDELRITPISPEMSIDIKPRSCPNPLNRKSNGVLPAAILGTEYLNVAEIDVQSVLLEGVAPIRTAYEDVSRPAQKSTAVLETVHASISDEPIRHGDSYSENSSKAEGPSARVPWVLDRCPCTTEGPDGFEDLTLKFDTQEIVAALGEVNDRDTVSLTLTASMVDGTELEASDCIIIVGGGGLGGSRASPGETQLERGKPTISETFWLSQPYPNPAAHQTLIEYAITEGSFVEFDLCNSAGRKVLTLVNGEQETGRYTIALTANDLPPGVYFYHLRANMRLATGKLVIVR